MAAVTHSMMASRWAPKSSQAAFNHQSSLVDHPAIPRSIPIEPLQVKVANAEVQVTNQPVTPPAPEVAATESTAPSYTHHVHSMLASKWAHEVSPSTMDDMSNHLGKLYGGKRGSMDVSHSPAATNAKGQPLRNATLALWQQACQDMGIEKPGNTVGQCKQVCAQSYTSSFDLADLDPQQLQTTITEYFEIHYVMSQGELAAWQRLCRDIGVKEGSSIVECERVGSSLVLSVASLILLRHIAPREILHQHR
jgi:hypothetical protein